MGVTDTATTGRTDLSGWIVHLTRNSDYGQAPDNLESILNGRRLLARSVLGLARKYVGGTPFEDSQRVCCFTETPVEELKHVAQFIPGRTQQYEPYGFAISRSDARRLGVNPIWYVDETPASGVKGGREWLTMDVKALLDEAFGEAKDYWTTSKKVDFGIIQKEYPSPVQRLLKLTPFMEDMRTETSYRKPKEFWWEREWRFVGDFLLPDRITIICPSAVQGRYDAIAKAVGYDFEFLSI